MELLVVTILAANDYVNACCIVFGHRFVKHTHPQEMHRIRSCNSRSLDQRFLSICIAIALSLISIKFLIHYVLVINKASNYFSVWQLLNDELTSQRMLAMSLIPAHQNTTTISASTIKSEFVSIRALQPDGSLEIKHIYVDTSNTEGNRRYDNLVNGRVNDESIVVITPQHNPGQQIKKLSLRGKRRNLVESTNAVDKTDHTTIVPPTQDRSVGIVVERGRSKVEVMSAVLVGVGLVVVAAAVALFLSDLQDRLRYEKILRELYRVPNNASTRVPYRTSTANTNQVGERGTPSSENESETLRDILARLTTNYTDVSGWRVATNIDLSVVSETDEDSDIMAATQADPFQNGDSLSIMSAVYMEDDNSPNDLDSKSSCKRNSFVSLLDEVLPFSVTKELSMENRVVNLADLGKLILNSNLLLSATHTDSMTTASAKSDAASVNSANKKCTATRDGPVEVSKQKCVQLDMSM